MPCPGREYIGDVDPWQWSPTHGIEANVDVKHGGHSLTGGLRANDDIARASGRRRVCLQDGANDEEERAHSEGGDDEGELASEIFNTEEDEDGCGNELDHTVDPRSKQRVLGTGIAD